ncbi:MULTISPECIES: hypothetical protein [Rhodopseudomonas]|uniref:Uncharacterized protein n=1 Tax=Rhodopseudomonas palustris TaxID=1076 RepID=A0A0D7EKS8_RHOPL|nr:MULTISPECIES: hypothetical protein [Rhodopseudomonas]KIZ41439.1 hypothetical protein OO17_15150 [Rhodopseudomonas palustris]MDF3810057.1 hypothetical protein [Rhodopseudomonas sp. BAL398]WOK18734.1 hypothetical protein RBJ75_04180 [Rhodopseudomonas sp. BAL398]
MTDASLRGEKLWGAPSIAQFMGLSCDTVYKLSDDPDCPIYRPPGTNRLFATRSELLVWLRTKRKLPDDT